MCGCASVRLCRSSAQVWTSVIFETSEISPKTWNIDHSVNWDQSCPLNITPSSSTFPMPSLRTQQRFLQGSSRAEMLSCLSSVAGLRMLEQQ